MAREAEERNRREEEARFMAEQQRPRDEVQRLQEEKEIQQRAKAEQEENQRLQRQVSLHQEVFPVSPDSCRSSGSWVSFRRSVNVSECFIVSSADSLQQRWRSDRNPRRHFNTAEISRNDPLTTREPPVICEESNISEH